MRRIFKYPLPFTPDEPATLDMPEGAEIVRLGLQGPAHGQARLTPTLWALVDDDKAWIAPDDEPLTTEQMVAVATLHEHGFGSVVSA